MDAVIICVPTPLNEYHEPDLSFVTGTVEAIAPYIHDGQLIVLESTTYPGTTEELVVPLLEKGNPHGLKVARDQEAPAFTSLFRPSAKTPATTPSPATTFPRLSAGAAASRLSWPARSMGPSFAASFRSAAHRSPR